MWRASKGDAVSYWPDCDIPEFYDETYPRAKKEHRCCECYGIIKAGERYARCVGKFDGAIFSEAQHTFCRDFGAEVNRAWGDDGKCFIAFGDINNSIANASEFAGPEDVIALQAMWAAIRARGRRDAVKS